LGSPIEMAGHPYNSAACDMKSGGSNCNYFPENH